MCKQALSGHAGGGSAIDPLKATARAEAAHVPAHARPPGATSGSTAPAGLLGGAPQIGFTTTKHPATAAAGTRCTATGYLSGPRQPKDGNDRRGPTTPHG